MLVIFTAANFGVIPNPALLSQVGDSDERYPCESCSCGCGSARQCWTSCCCHTPTERLAWAIANGVKPPDFVTFSTETWIAAANSMKAGSASCAGCVSKIQAQLACGEGGKKTYTGLAITAMKCRGLHSLLLVAAPPSLHQPAIHIVDEPESGFRRMFVDDRAADSRALDTPAPPPRAGARIS